MSKTPSRILIADDHAGARQGIADIIRSSGENWVVCAEADDGQSAIQNAIARKPDLVILDVRMPRIDGVQAAREIRRLLPEVPILFYTLLATPALELATLAAGFQGVVSKPDSLGLVSAIRKCLPAKGSPAPGPGSPAAEAS